MGVKKIVGPTGPKGDIGPTGPQGNGLQIMGSYSSEEELLQHHPTGNIGESYIISGDLGYISSYKDARNKIQEIDRAKIVEILLKDFQSNNK